MSTSQTPEENVLDPVKKRQLLKLFEKTCPRPAQVDQAQVQPRDQLRHALFYIGSDKGQLISECLFGDINFPKKQRKNLTNFCPRNYKVVKPTK